MAKTFYAVLVFALFFLNVVAQESKYEMNKIVLKWYRKRI